MDNWMRMTQAEGIAIAKVLGPEQEFELFTEPKGGECSRNTGSEGEVTRDWAQTVRASWTNMRTLALIQSELGTAGRF